MKQQQPSAAPRGADDRFVPESEALRGLAAAVAGEVRSGRHDRMLYATDASLYQVEPLAVVIPGSVEDAVAAVRYCADRMLPVLPRGGGTSLAGQCTNRAVVLDLSVNCRSVLEIDAAAHRCRVEPGITIDELNALLAPTGQFFAPDPATSRHCNIGGAIGNNAAGARSIRYGRTSESLLGVDAVLATGQRVQLDRGAAGRDPVAAALTAGVVDVVRRHERVIRERFPRTVRRNAGYGLDMVLRALDEGGGDLGAVNLAHLLAGSEGTLAVTLGAELRLHPLPAAKGLAALAFESVDAAIAAVAPILGTCPSAVELLDDVVLGLAGANAIYRRYVDLMPRTSSGEIPRAVLYVEYFAGGPDASGSGAGAWIEGRFGVLREWFGDAAVRTYTDAGAMLEAWTLRKAGEPLLHGMPGARKPITFIEDNAIPVERLGEFVRRLREIVGRHGTRAAYWAHASVGVLHVRPMLDIHDEGDRGRLRAIAVETARLARELGGVMSGEHGDGRVRGPLLGGFYGPELMRAFGEVKRIFDPRGLLNPGMIVPAEGAWRDGPRPEDQITVRLRVRPEGGEVRVPPVRTWFDYEDQHGFAGAVEMCNGAGVCRKKQGGTMCPSYMATLDERHSTRGRGNALRLAITGQFSGGGPEWTDAQTAATLDLCLSCKACKTECPSNVDIARLKAEFTAHRYQEDGGAPPTVRVMASIRALNRVGSLTPGLANRAMAIRPLRRAVDRVLGIHPRRSLPPLARSLERDFREVDRFVPTGESADRRPMVALFGDCFSLYNEPGVGRAARALLEACGYRVLLPRHGCCGRPAISLGLLGRAAEEVDRACLALRPYVEDSRVRAVLFLEPSCLSAVKDDWLSLRVGTAVDVRRRLAAKSLLVEDFLDRAWESHPARPRLAEGPCEILLHGHCHQKALWGAGTSARALSRLPGATVRLLDSGCCGMAGSFGYAAHRHALSMKIGELSLFPAVRSSPDAVIAATGTSCRHQIHDGTGRRAMHPVEIMAGRLAAGAEASAGRGGRSR